MALAWLSSRQEGIEVGAWSGTLSVGQRAPLDVSFVRLKQGRLYEMLVFRVSETCDSGELLARRTFSARAPGDTDPGGYVSNADRSSFQLGVLGPDCVADDYLLSIALVVDGPEILAQEAIPFVVIEGGAR